MKKVLLLLIFFITILFPSDVGTNDFNKICHISIDDTIIIFDDITKNASKYKSIFDNDSLNFLKQMHDKYGIKIVMFCFNEYGGVNLSDCTDDFAMEFIRNSDWLKFGYHADNPDSFLNTDDSYIVESYKNMNREIKRITGEDFCVRAIRLDRFCGTYQQIQALNKNFNVSAFFTADDKKRKSYYLNEELQKEVWQKDILKDNNIIFTPSDIRIERVKHLKSLFKKHKNDSNLVIFTHEICLLDEKVRRNMEKLIVLAIENGNMFSDYIFDD